MASRRFFIGTPMRDRILQHRLLFLVSSSQSIQAYRLMDRPANRPGSGRGPLRREMCRRGQEDHRDE